MAKNYYRIVLYIAVHQGHGIGILIKKHLRSENFADAFYLGLRIVFLQ